MDAIECGIVKLPRVPIMDNVPGGKHAHVPQSLGLCGQEPAEEGAGECQGL